MILKQALIIVILSIAVALVSNGFRQDGISLFKKSLQPAATTLEDNLEVEQPVIQSVNLEQAYELYNNNVTFIDARDIDEYNQGHIPHALPNPGFFELLSDLNKLISKQEPIITYCGDAQCGLSEDLADGLAGEGYTNIYVFLGGWNLWLEAGYPVEQ
jgi:rhodanese-related sulfurtransferase